MSDFPANRVTLARILRPHGRRGEVAAAILTDFPERLTRLTSALLWDGKDDPRAVTIRRCWLSHSRGGQAIFHFEVSNSISEAEKLVGLDVQVPLAERVKLPPGGYYVTDLVGCEVFRGLDSGGVHKIGTVRDVQLTGKDVSGTPVLIVDSPDGELLIPLAVEICVRVRTDQRRIEIDPPEGLLDLNRK